MSTQAGAHSAELDRIRSEYERRAREVDADTYQPARPANLFMRQAVERGFLRALERGGLLPLAGKRILEVGCGVGQWLADLETWGAQREQLAGIDLISERAERARLRVPGAEVHHGSASELPWSDQSFDVVLQVMLLSSVLDDGLRRQIAAEMSRVLASGGALVSLDFFVGNPVNRSVRALTRTDLRAIFPGYAIRARRVMLAPPLARALVPRAWWAASLLQATHLFDTHAVAVLTRR